jgi:hypothetical protein
MGVHSTILITEEDARESIKKVDWDSIPNQVLSDVWDVLIYEKLYNCMIVSDPGDQSHMDIEENFSILSLLDQ